MQNVYEKLLSVLLSVLLCDCTGCSRGAAGVLTGQDVPHTDAAGVEKANCVCSLIRAIQPEVCPEAF